MDAKLILMFLWLMFLVAPSQQGLHPRYIYNIVVWSNNFKNVSTYLSVIWQYNYTMQYTVCVFVLVKAPERRN